MTNPILLASNAKGQYALLKRGRSIAGRYGLTTKVMNRALRRFSEVLKRFDCCATFPITAVTLRRHHNTIARYLDQNIEFAVHGYTHVDYEELAPEAQLANLQHAREIFTKAGIVPMGFRSPYLRHETQLCKAIEAAGFCYASNQPFLWDVIEAEALTPSLQAGYERAIAFYGPWRATERLSLPRRNGQLVEIPVSLPDDEILIERLGGSNGLAKETWVRILSQSYQRGELFTLQLHPERIALCADSLSVVLAKARALTPAVWCARLSEIATWWKARARVNIDVTCVRDDGFQIQVSAPIETMILARAVQVDAPTAPWADGFHQIKARSFTVNAPIRPFLGISPATPPVLASFLREQGYIIEINEDRNHYACYIDQPEFVPENERLVLAQIEGRDFPLVRLGCWPNGARSALCVTGDIDALTLWDYGLRLIGQ